MSQQPKPPHAVFSKINMKGGNIHECWPWLGTVIRSGTPDAYPIHYVFSSRVSVRKLVYSLKRGVKLSKVPKLHMACGNNLCCNPYHMVKYKGSGLTQDNKKAKITSHEQGTHNQSLENT